MKEISGLDREWTYRCRQMRIQVQNTIWRVFVTDLRERGRKIWGGYKIEWFLWFLNFWKIKDGKSLFFVIKWEFKLWIRVMTQTHQKNLWFWRSLHLSRKTGRLEKILFVIRRIKRRKIKSFIPHANRLMWPKIKSLIMKVKLSVIFSNNKVSLQSIINTWKNANI